MGMLKILDVDRFWFWQWKNCVELYERRLELQYGSRMIWGLERIDTIITIYNAVYGSQYNPYIFWKIFTPFW